jgi:cytochrome c553
MNWINDRRHLAMAAALALLTTGAGAADLKRGEALYEICGSCHGDKGQGEDRMAVPAIAGQDTEYLQRQLRYFAKGVRAGPPDSPAGQMVAIMKFAAEERDWTDILGFVATLPPPPRGSAPAPGDLQRGEQLFIACAACHGAQGEGNRILSAPALAGLQAWYIAAQLRNFRSGARGSAAGDVPGAQMRAAAAVLRSDADVVAVSAYSAYRPRR